MTATVIIAEGDRRADGPVPEGSYVDALVVRVQAEFDIDPRVIRGLATELLATFEGARVQTFVPILVEKGLRERCRALSVAPGRA